MSTDSFKTACSEYRFLREREYPEKAALKIVSDKHRLSRQERNCLFRGIMSPAVAEARMKRIVAAASVAGRALGIDWYNVLITVESYLHGHAVFTCDDGMMRDVAAAHGSYRASAVTAAAITAIAGAVRSLAPSRVDAFVDSPIAYSMTMGEEARRALGSAGVLTEVVLVHSADYPLKTYSGIVASSDSVVLDAAAEAFDLARHALAGAYRFIPPRVGDLFP